MSVADPAFLIVRLGSLGDVVHAIPAAAALARRYPRAAIDWLVDPRYADLLQIVAGLRRAIPLDPRGGAGTLLQAIGTLRRQRYEAAVDLQGLIKSAVLARLAGARRTIGLPREHLREPAARAFYSETADPGRDPHVIRKGLAMMGALGVSETSVRFPLRIPPSEPAARVEARFGGGYVVLNPGAAWPNKRWAPERFGAVAAAIRDRLALASLVLWGPGEAGAAAAVVAASRGAAELSPPTAIVDLPALLRGARLVISGDTGPLHIAGAVGAPIVALFGPTLAERNGPWSPEDIIVSRTARCECHYQRTCRRGEPCLDTIEVDEVVAAAERRLGGRG